MCLLACIVSSTEDVPVPIRFRAGLRHIPLYLLLFSGMLIAYLCIRKEHAFRKWNHALSCYSASPEKALSELDSLHPSLSTHPVFLYTYGKALNLSGKYAEALPLLHQALQRQASYQILIEAGKSHAGISNSAAAVRCWRKAGKMLPNRLLPGYLCARMYEQSRQIDSARKTAETTLRIVPKIDSPESRKIQRELHRIASLE